MMSLSYFIIVLLFLVPFSSSEDMNRFSTKTAYIFKQQSIPNYADFEATKVWALLRHGTRLPSKKVISRYSGLIEIRDEMLRKSNQLSDQQREAFLKWKPMEIKLEQQKFLTKEGELEHFQLGARFKKRFPMFFDGQSEFTFKHTPTQRTEVSAAKFIEGMFAGEAENYKSVVVERDDPVLRPYKGCSLWRKTVKKNKEISLKEHRSFADSQHVQDLVRELQNFTQVDFTAFDVEHIYTMCGFETAWQYNLLDGKSVWCTLFPHERQLKVMEYLEDLEYFWIDGHGFEITRKVACKTVQDILEKLDPSNKDRGLTFYFTHSGTILKLLTFLGLYKDDFELTAESFRDDRLWKTSLIDTFSSNLIVILYDSQLHGPHIQLLHQEQIIDVPKCQMNKYGMCPYEAFKAAYQEKITNCSLQEICQIKDEL